MAAEKSTAIVLRVTEFSESSCVAMLFTREFGKQTLIGKGARRPKSPFEAALDVLAICRIVFLQNSSGAMGTLTEAKLDRRFRNQRKELEWLYAAFYVVELLKTLVEEGDPHPELYDLAVQTIGQLDGRAEMLPGDQSDAILTNDECQRSANEKMDELNVVLLRFEVGLLTQLGHFPLLTHCVGCGRERTSNLDVAFGLSTGGILCPKCRPSQSNVVQVTAPALEAWAKFRIFHHHVHHQLDNQSPPMPLIHSTNPAQALGVKESKPQYPTNPLLPTPTQPPTPTPTLPTNYFPPMTNLELELDLAPLREVRNVMNQYLAMLAGREFSSARFLGELSKAYSF